MTEKNHGPDIEAHYLAVHARCLTLLDSIYDAMHAELPPQPCNDDDEPIRKEHAEKTEAIERMLKSTLEFLKGTNS